MDRPRNHAGGRSRPRQICLKEAGIEENSQEVSTPVDEPAKDPKNRDEIVNSEESNQVLNPPMTTKNRAIVARLNS